jgi:thioredoxin reductase (NADPH)
VDAQLHLSQQVAQLQRMDDGRWLAQTTHGLALHARSVFIAAGVGAFVPKALKVPGVELLAPGQLHYHPANLDVVRGQAVVVHGGDEEAVAAAIACADRAQTTYLLYRRDAFQASAPLLERLQALRNNGAIRVVIGQITQLHADAGLLRAVQWMDGEGQEHELAAQQLVVCLGISPRLGPVAEWGLAMERKQLLVNPATQATDAPGIYAIGDIVSYPGKHKLILCGFHEATMAAFAAAEYLLGEKPLLQYTTTSARLHAILGVAHPEA